jgi:hypothetical protein
MIVFAAILGGFTFLANFMSNGFFLAWVKTKASRGRKVLIIMRTKLSYYPAFGHVEGQTFVWKDRETRKDSKNKIPKRAKLPDPNKSPFFRLFNVWVTIIDEGTSAFISMKDYSEISGYDPVLQESLIMRALQRPTFEQNKQLIIILVLVGVVVLLLLGAAIYMKINTLPAIIQNARAIPASITGVNV